VRRLVLAALVAFLATPCACAARDPSSRPAEAPVPAPPRRRTSGPRAIPFAGGDPAARGWVKEDGLLWVEERDVAAFRKGNLRLEGRWVSFAEADAAPKTPETGYVLRTDHVVLRTDVPFARARELAAVAQRHVTAVLDAFGEALDLHLPADPLPVVVAARRSEYDRLLAARAPGGADWGAFYVAADGRVYACDEPRGQGGLSVVADLRHEMTHALLDLGRPEEGRARMFVRPQFWLWEAVAIWTEGLGDPPGARHGTERFERFRRRLAWDQAVPLAELFALRQADFQGRHYDQSASFVAWLMETDGGALRPRTLELLGRVMDGWGETDDVERFLGLSTAEAERRWLAWARAGGEGGAR
jgi:hypothetical protein